jgi:tetrapyrrole methylase family protein/MazG family protein
MALAIVGLGPGGADLLTAEARRLLSRARVVFVRSPGHPALAALPQKATVRSLHHLFRGKRSLEQVYDAIVDQVLGEARRVDRVVYAAVGDPLTDDGLAGVLHAACQEEGLPCTVAAAPGLRQALCRALDLDAMTLPIRVVDALSPRLDTQRSVFITQVCRRWLASRLRTKLLERYPPEHPVAVVQVGEDDGPSAREVPLERLDRARRYSALTCLYLPPLSRERDRRSFAGLQQIVARLRAPDGCPWDREQTHESLKSYVIEEAYEVLAALDEGDLEKLREELGDLLWQVMIHVQIASEAGEFEMGDVLAGIGDKLVRRHPHVFGDAHVDSAEEVVSNWEVLKQRERDKDHPLLSSVPQAMPALAHTRALLDRAAGVGFEWPDVAGALDKLVEEVSELAQVEDAAQRRDEFGDVLFVLVAVARHLDVNAEEALRLAARKFRRRFSAMENLARSRGLELAKLSLAEMELLWKEVK